MYTQVLQVQQREVSKPDEQSGRASQKDTLRQEWSWISRSHSGGSMDIFSIYNNRLYSRATKPTAGGRGGYEAPGKTYSYSQFVFFENFPFVAFLYYLIQFLFCGHIFFTWEHFFIDVCHLSFIVLLVVTNHEWFGGGGLVNSVTHNVTSTPTVVWLWNSDTWCKQTAQWTWPVCEEAITDWLGWRHLAVKVMHIHRSKGCSNYLCREGESDAHLHILYSSLICSKLMCDV